MATLPTDTALTVRLAALNEVLDIIDTHKNVPNVVRDAILDLAEATEAELESA